MSVECYITSRLVSYLKSAAGAPLSRTAGVLGLVLGSVLWSGPAWSLEFDYEAPIACPNRDAFWSEVRSRLRYPAEQSTVERLQVTVRRQQEFQASFVLIEPGQPPVSRTLTAQVCDEAVRALALGAALALDARYREVRGIPEHVPEPSPSSAVAPTEPAVGSAAPEVTLAPARAVAGEPFAAPSAAPPVAPSPPTAASAAPSAIGGVGVDTREPAPERAAAPGAAALTVAARLGAFAATGYSPDPSFGPSMGVLVRGERFALALDAFVSAENQAGNGERRAEFWVVGGRLSPCLRWPLAGGFSTRGCGVLELSGVHAEGVDGPDVLSTDEDLAPYWALGVVTGAEAPLAGMLSVSLDLGVQFPLSERRFYFKSANGDEALHEFPPVAARGQLAICYAF